jgi:hypothetical protein
MQKKRHPQVPDSRRIARCRFHFCIACLKFPFINERCNMVIRNKIKRSPMAHKKHAIQTKETEAGRQIHEYARCAFEARSMYRRLEMDRQLAKGHDSSSGMESM